jgi:VIT1/CCC1 family predicted Fe2+/Mn2+ transporter
VLTAIRQNIINHPTRILEPHERISEVLFGLIMVLTFTGSLSIAEAGREDIRVMLVGALSCLAERGRNLTIYRALRATNDPTRAQQLVSDALPPIVVSILEPTELESMHQRLQQLPDPPSRPRLTARDWLGALGVFLFVFATTFPVAIPFVVMSRAHVALRVSNAIAVFMLFVCGYAFGRVTHVGGWLMGTVMVVLGMALVALTMALGG